MTIGTFLFTLFRGRLVGRDQFSNRYYEDKKCDAYGRYRRWVIYNHTAEASLVPPNWHSWLHGISDEPLEGHYEWQKKASGNLSGTDGAYGPDSMKKGRRPGATGDYQAWRPE